MEDRHALLTAVVDTTTARHRPSTSVGLQESVELHHHLERPALPWRPPTTPRAKSLSVDLRWTIIPFMLLTGTVSLSAQ